MTATMTAPQAPVPTPVTADSALFTFYDIESLSNAFTLCAFTPVRAGQPGRATLEVFYLLDDSDLLADLDPLALKTRIAQNNPALPADTEITLRDLGTADGSARLARLIGLSDARQVNDPGSFSRYPAAFRPVCDTDPDYDAGRHPFLAGYNSANYDTVMLALYLMEAFPAQHRPGNPFQRVSARTMREHSNTMFEGFRSYMPGYLIDEASTEGTTWDSPQKRIHQAMIHSGRHLDVARLNEVQQRVALKRLLGMLGGQILESDKLSAYNSVLRDVDDLYELLAYNVSDCVGLALLFRHPTYASAFDLKRSLLDQYPECVYETGHVGDQTHVRRARLTPDSSSAKFVGQILCPDGHLDDIETVSFLYPSQRVAQERGIERVDVLEESRKFFESRITNDPDSDAHRRFMDVYSYYASIRDQNFNDSAEYRETFPDGPPAKVLNGLGKLPNNLPYFTAQGHWSTCFATFSTGGIHGAEADLGGFIADNQTFYAQTKMLEFARQVFSEERGGAKALVAEAKRQHNELRLPDGSVVDKAAVLLGSDPAKVKYRRPKKDDPAQQESLARAQALVPDPADLLATQRPDDQKLHVRVMNHATGEIRVIDGKSVLASTTQTGAAFRDIPGMARPVLFEQRSDGSTKLKPKYGRTSAGLVTHEDFTSYYPNLLRNMSAFYNAALGEDRYARIFFQKEDLGRQMKAPGLSQDEKARLKTLRNGTKLILNAASGAGDASHRTPIRMNNQIISMRIIGQLFSWRIGQAQTLAGARIISTNTDGLYSVLDWDLNKKVLEEQAALINVDIEPEAMFLISKDSNNRLELEAPTAGNDVATARLISASGGTLACYAGPRPDKALAHPAVIDHTLAQYLRQIASRQQADPGAFARPFDRELGRRLIEAAAEGGDVVSTALLFQTMVTASPGSITYPFAVDPVGPLEADTELEHRRPRALQHFNRAFFVRAGTEAAVNLHNAGAWVVNPASKAKRQQDPQTSQVDRTDRVAMAILKANGWAESAAEARAERRTLIPVDQDVAVRKISSIDPAWPVVLENRDLRELDEAVLRRLIEDLDLEIYVRLLDETYTKNWMNTAAA